MVVFTLDCPGWAGTTLASRGLRPWGRGRAGLARRVRSRVGRAGGASAIPLLLILSQARETRVRATSRLSLASSTFRSSAAQRITGGLVRRKWSMGQEVQAGRCRGGCNTVARRPVCGLACGPVRGPVRGSVSGPVTCPFMAHFVDRLARQLAGRFTGWLAGQFTKGSRAGLRAASGFSARSDRVNGARGWA
jgi:hypothetical protein